jgi:hypothetical protein
MKKIVFSEHVLPHLIAVASFLIVTLFFFKPVFFDHKKINQADIVEWQGSAKELQDFREQTGEEGLWTNSMFGGMPAYLVNVNWSNQPVAYLKKIMAFALPHPVANIYLAFVSYYILLLAFGVRPYLAIGGALAFGLSSYMLIGLAAGHNARVGAVAFMPLVMAGIHLVFNNRRIVGFGLTALGFALQLKENHLQITYYLAIIVVVYGVVQLIRYMRAGQLSEWGSNVGILVPAVLIGIGSFLGPLWAVTEYSADTIRGKSELVSSNATATGTTNGLPKDYAFEFSNGLLEPMTLFIPNFYGGASGEFFVQDEKSNTYAALVRSGDQETANQLAMYTSAYWGEQRLSAPYYAGAIIVFLFALGIAFADKHLVWWLVTTAIIGIVLSWGRNLEWFNYFLFDYLPGYNKFRSVTFAIVITLFSLPLLGFVGLERLIREGLDKAHKKKLIITAAVIGGLCILAMVASAAFDFLKDGEQQLPAWFTNALADDRQGALISDAFRSLAFVIAAFALIYFGIFKRLPIVFYVMMGLAILIDHVAVDKRYIREENFIRNVRTAEVHEPTEADRLILSDKSHYRVFTINPQDLSDTWKEARTSYFHHSIGGYHAAKLKRYQDLVDSCLYKETVEFVTDAQQRNIKLENYGVMNMLNVKYLVFGTQANAVLDNPEANGNAWFVRDVKKVNSPSEELVTVCDTDTKTTAVIDVSKFPNVNSTSGDTSSVITLLDYKPNYLKYESQSSADGVAVFSEVYYEKGWKAFIDGAPSPILRANYLLRALNVPGGKHVVEFRFQPDAYIVGNKITAVSSWLVVIVLLGSIWFSLRRRD